jgi:hypothetical protein
MAFVNLGKESENVSQPIYFYFIVCGDDFYFLAESSLSMFG